MVIFFEWWIFLNLNFKSCTKTSFKTLQVLKGYFGHFWGKRYFDHLKALGGTLVIFSVLGCVLVILEVYGYFGHLLALLAYFSHFGWSDCVNRVNQSFPLSGYNNYVSIKQPNRDPKSDHWFGRMWWNICFCKLQWQSNDQILRTK